MLEAAKAEAEAHKRWLDLALNSPEDTTELEAAHKAWKDARRNADWEAHKKAKLANA